MRSSPRSFRCSDERSRSSSVIESSSATDNFERTNAALSCSTRVSIMSVYSTHNPESSAVRTTHGDPRYREGMRDRGKALDAPTWWLELARAKVRKTKGLIVLGQELARLAGRATPWSHTVLSKFANGEIQPTQELALAISSHFSIPRPFYVPRDPNEGRAMQAIVDMRTVPVPVPETSR